MRDGALVGSSLRRLARLGFEEERLCFLVVVVLVRGRLAQVLRVGDVIEFGEL